WAYDLGTLGLVGSCVWVMFSKKVGGIKIGGKDAKPVMSRWAWFVISLCGGIATGIVFWGIAEPVTHFVEGIPVFGYESQSQNAALLALSTTYLHWGFSEYAYYCVAGIAIGVSVYNLKLPYRVCSCLYPLLGDRAMGKLGTVIDILCVFGLAGGVSGSLCEGVLQIGAGLGIVTGITVTRYVWIVILVAVVITFILSSYTGIAKGVRFFSDANAKLYMALLAFVLFFGPTKFILNLGTEALGFHLDNFFTQSTFLSAIDGDQWPIWWTINYWSWMIAYAPLMGIFLAKIARGRSLKDFTIYNFLLPGCFGILWFAIFGSAAINYEINGAGIYETMSSLGTEAAVFSFFDNLPLSQVLCVIFMFTIFISIVTLADSMTTTISSLSIVSKTAGTAEPPTPIKIFWGVLMSTLAFVNIASASTTGEVSAIDATKSLAIVCAFPLLIVMILMLISAIKMLNQYDQYNTVDDPEHSIVNPALIVDVKDEEIM
ncbi:MAG: BCCT family transporter, partial [Lachnospiraceae bacterium]|nr:BCCT family transporter [Lachnospiraceae bacterium]